MPRRRARHQPASREATTCTATYTVTQADINNGSVKDSAVASGTTGVNTTITSNTATASVTATQTPGISLTKTASPTAVTTVGQTVTYTFAAQNTGNVTLSGLTVADTQASPAGPLASGPTCTTTTLVPGAGTTCTATYPVDPGRPGQRVDQRLGHRHRHSAHRPANHFFALSRFGDGHPDRNLALTKRPRPAPSARSARPSPTPSQSRTPATSPSPA